MNENRVHTNKQQIFRKGQKNVFDTSVNKRNKVLKWNATEAFFGKL